MQKLLVNNHRLSTQVGAKRAKTCMQRVHVPPELPFCMPPLVVGGALRTATAQKGTTARILVCSSFFLSDRDGGQDILLGTNAVLYL